MTIQEWEIENLELKETSEKIKTQLDEIFESWAKIYSDDK